MCPARLLHNILRLLSGSAHELRSAGARSRRGRSDVGNRLRRGGCVGRRGPAATALMGVAVEVYARAGEMDAAFERLELLLAIPAGREATIPYLRLWPGFDPLRTDPRFEQLLARFGSSG